MNNELYEKIEDAFVSEAKLVKKLNLFMYEYNNFEYDEMGINMDEADDVKARIEKIQKKLMNNVNSKLDTTLDTKSIDIVFHKVNLSTTIDEEIKNDEEDVQIIQKEFNFAIIVDNDGFELEIEKEQENNDENDKNETNNQDITS